MAISGIKHIEIWSNDTYMNGIKHNDIRVNDTGEALSIVTFGRMTLIWTALNKRHSDKVIQMNASQLNDICINNIKYNDIKMNDIQMNDNQLNDTYMNCIKYNAFN